MINRKLQYCTEPIIEYVDVIKEVIVEKTIEVEVQKEVQNDEFPNFQNPTKQKLFLSSSIEIVKLEVPDTLFALFESPYEYTQVQPISNNFTYSISNAINQNGQKLNEFSFLEKVGSTDLLNNYKIQLYEHLKLYSEDPYEHSKVMAWQNSESIEYKLGIGFSWLALTSWSSGIILKLSDDNRSTPFFLSAIVFKIIQKNLFDKMVLKKILSPSPHFDQFLDYEELVALADKYNKQIFEEIKSIN